MSDNRKRIALAIGIIVSAIFLGLAFRGLHPAQFWASIQQANPVLLILAMGVYGIAVTIISLRWQFLLRALAPVSLANLIPLVSIGYMGNNIYPFRSGEVLRIVLLRRHHDVPYARGATTVIVERVFDGLVMLTFVLLPLTFLDVVSDNVQRIATLTTPIFLSALAVFLVLAARPNWLRALVSLVARWLPSRLQTILTDLSEEIILGLEGLRTPADFIGTVISSYATWAVEASVYWIVAFAFGLDLSYPVMLLTVGVVNLAGLLPASPGMIGVFEFFVREVLVAVGVDETTALAYAIAVHVVIWLPPTLAGFIFLTREGMGLRDVASAQKLKQSTAG